MLDLDDPRWSQLRHAYGLAADIPGLLKRLADMPSSADDNEPWFSLWSALAHQGDVYPASFAAVPHVVAAIASCPTKADFSYFQFPAWVEICRARSNAPVPEDLAPAYFEALSRLPALVAAAAPRQWDEALLCSALSAIAAAKGEPRIAEAVLDMTPDLATDFMEWLHRR